MDRSTHAEPRRSTPTRSAGLSSSVLLALTLAAAACSPSIGTPDGGHPDGGLPDGGGQPDGGGLQPDGGSGADTRPAQVPSSWRLVLDDDFPGSSLNSSYWNVGTNLGSFSSGGTTYWDTYIAAESEYVTGSMVAVQSSNLVLSTMATSPISGDQGSKSYISGYVTSFGLFSFQYGYLEFRAKLPAATSGSQTGLWPALWLFNSTYSNADEIDVVESFGGDQTSLSMTIHNSTLTGNQDSVSVNVTPGYHTFGVLHQASSIAFYVDDALQGSFNVSLASQMAILMGLQLGNASMGWISGPVPSTWGGGIHGANTADLNVDCVHVWTP